MANEIYFYQPEFTVSDRQIILEDEEHNHLSRVLRLREGFAVYVSNGKGLAAGTVIHSIGKKETVLSVSEMFPQLHELPVRIKLAVGMIKATHWEWLIEKATELGVTSIIPLLTRYTVVRQFRSERSEKIITAALKQSCRSVRPDLEPLQSFDAFTKSDLSRIKLIFDNQSPAESVHHNMNSYSQQEITLLIGPEGGFSESEVDFAVKNGYLLTLLGTRRLRTETAAISALSNVVSYVEGVKK